MDQGTQSTMLRQDRTVPQGRQAGSEMAQEGGGERHWSRWSYCRYSHRLGLTSLSLFLEDHIALIYLLTPATPLFSHTTHVNDHRMVHFSHDSAYLSAFRLFYLLLGMSLVCPALFCEKTL